MGWTLAIETGGTFTDVFWIDEASARYGTGKVPTTPDDQSRGFVEGLPVGLQLMGRATDDATLLRVADAYQRRCDWHARRPQEAA